MKNGLTDHPDQSVQLSRERFILCMESVWELDAIATTMPSFVDEVSDGGVSGLILRSLSCRIGILAGALMEGLSDGSIELEGLSKRIMLMTAIPVTEVAA